MDKLNPYYLVKDEVELEVKVRGEVPSAGVADLRKQLRSLVRSGMLWSLNYTMKRMRRDLRTVRSRRTTCLLKLVTWV